MTKLQKRLVKLVLWQAFLVVCLSVLLGLLGVDVLKILGGLSLGGIALAFIAKDYLASIAATFTIAFGDHYDIGDWVEVGGKSGRVERVTLNYTYLCSRENREYDTVQSVIPNSEVVNKGYLKELSEED